MGFRANALRSHSLMCIVTLYLATLLLQVPHTYITTIKLNPIYSEISLLLSFSLSDSFFLWLLPMDCMQSNGNK